MTTPKPRSPLGEIEVPKWMVDTCRLPVKNACEALIDDQELVLVDVTVHEDMGMLRGRLHPLAPLFDSTHGWEAFGRLGNSLPGAAGVKGSPEPVRIGAVVVGWRSGAG